MATKKYTNNNYQSNTLKLKLSIISNMFLYFIIKFEFKDKSL